MAKRKIHMNQLDSSLLKAEVDYFRETDTFNITMSGTGFFQGVTSDSTYIYASSNNYLYKYNKSTKALVTSRDVNADGTTTNHVGDIHEYNGVIYGCSSNYATLPASTHIVRWNASDLTYIGETSVSTTEWNSTISFYDGYLWMVLYSGKVAKVDPSTFTILTTYTLPDLFESGTYNYDGMAWIDNMLYLNPHENMQPQTTHQFLFTGTEFIHTRSVAHPREATQGMDYDADTDTVYFITRVSPRIILTKMEKDDLRMMSFGAYGQVGTITTTTSTTYVEDTTLQAELFVKKGDVVECYLGGVWRVTTSACRVYIDVSGTSVVAATNLVGGESLRTAQTGSEGIALSQTKLFRAEADGILKMGQYWRINAAGTLTRESGSIILKVVGREFN